MTTSPDRLTRRAKSIRETAETDPEAVDVEELIGLLTDGDKETRRLANEAYDELASARQSIPEAVAEHLESALAASDTETRRRAVLATTALAERHPEAVAKHRSELESIGSDRADPSREPAVIALAKLAMKRPDLGAPATEPLVDMCHSRVDLGDAPKIEGVNRTRRSMEEKSDRQLRDSPERTQRDTARIHAVAGLTRIAADRPGTVADHVPRIGRLLELDDDHHLVRGGACEVLEAMAETHPDLVEPFVPSLVELVATTAERAIVWRAADALGAIGAQSPDLVGEAVASFASELEPRLESMHAGIRGVGVGILTYAAESDPSSVEPFVPRLQELLADDEPSVRANAALTLGLVGAKETRAELATLAADDPDEDVRKLAARAIERLQSGSVESGDDSD